MTNGDILRMARKAGLLVDYGEWRISEQRLMEFASLVTAAEREACAKHYLDVMRKAVEEEREACAKVCEARASEEVGMAYEGIALECATAIRTRNNDVR